VPDGSGRSATLLSRFSFSFDSVPEVPFYSLEVGRRGALTYSLADMQSRNWVVGGTIGS
jgi:hypothetical protein